MNIFVLHDDPILAAQDLCEKHVTKMYLESAQLLQTCFPQEVLASPDCPRNAEGNVRKHSYFNHPCAKWTRKSRANMLWLLNHADEMERERLRRGYNPHKTVPFVNWARANIDRSWVSSGDLTEYAIAISEDKNCRKVVGFNDADTVTKYRLYYVHDKPFASWKNGAPEWFSNMKAST